MDQEGFLGTSATLGADITIVAYILILIPLMVIGFIFARGKRFEPHHKLVMTTITLSNWVLIIVVMLVTYTEAIAPGVPEQLGERDYWLPTLHLLTGGTAQILATYLLTRMWFEKSLPDWFKIKNIKLAMRITLGLWVFTAGLGIIMYAIWYTDIATAGSDITPVSTEEAPVSTEEAPNGEATPEATEDAPLSTEEAGDADTAEDPVATEESEAESGEEDPIATEEADTGDASDIESDEEEPIATEETNADEANDASDPVVTEEAE